MPKQISLGEVHDCLTGTTTALYNSIIEMENRPSVKNKRELRRLFKEFNDWEKLLAHRAKILLNVK